MSSTSDVVNVFRNALEELHGNNKNQIHCLAMLAMDYMEHSGAIVDAIRSRVYTVPSDKKLVLLYVVDAILKSPELPSYKQDILRIIVKTFLHVFVNGDERIRLSLYKLRQTWNNIVADSILLQLDVKIHALDGAWPVFCSMRNCGKPQRVQTHHGVVSSVIRPTTTAESVQGATDKVGSIIAIIDANHGEQQTSRPSWKHAGNKRPADRTESSQPSRKFSPVPICDVDLRLPSRKFSPVPICDVDLRLVSPTTTPVAEVPWRNTDAYHHRQGLVNTRNTPSLSQIAWESPNLENRKQQSLLNTTSLPSTPLSCETWRSTHRQGFASAGDSPVINGPSGLPAPHQLLCRSNLPSQISPVVAVHDSNSAAIGAPTRNPVEISNETIRLLGIPENNRIFVDGRAHEVIFIQDTAVIERNGLPHRIFFSGPPRNVIIDNIPHKLAFGERLKISIDGLQHTLRFGSPSRELYMGDFSFKGVFGGPPIIAHINGKRHEIRLSGPAPEVKIEPEPAHDLYRFVCQRREQKQPAERQGTRISDFLSGVLKKVKEISSQSTPVVAKKPSRFLSDLAAPIPYRDELHNIERRLTPSRSLTNFDMKILGVRYEVFVNALHQRHKDACSQCGLLISFKSEKYVEHMDWHVKKNLQRLERSSNCRPLYCAAKDWLRNDLDNSNPSLGPNDSSLHTVANPFTESHAVQTKKCMVCDEQFAEVYDPDTDKWILQDCVKVNEKVFHSGCMSDSMSAGFAVKKEADSNENDCSVNDFDKEIKVDRVF